MDSIGEIFYKNFFCRFQTYVAKDRQRYEKVRSDTDWTIYIKEDFLTTLAKSLDFDVIEKEDIHGIDLTWERTSDNILVAIEHENVLKDVWESEIPNLLRAAAQLKVLITYVDDASFPGREIADRVYSILKKKRFKDQFLLILGTVSLDEPTDWTGYLYMPELAMKNLICCSNMVYVEKSPGRKAWKTRRGET